MEGAAYILCALTAFICAVLLLRRYGQIRTRLLLWCGIFFLTMTLENVILFMDMAVGPNFDLSTFRRSVALAGVITLLYGLIMDVK